MIRLTQLIGQPTIALADAEQTGRVKGVRIDRDRIVAVHTGDGLIETSAIRSFEGDALTYDGVLQSVPDDADSPLGRRVLDEDGDELGRLADVEVEADGTVSVMALDDGRTLPGVALRAVGSYAVIVAALPDTTLTDRTEGGVMPPPSSGNDRRAEP